MVENPSTPQTYPDGTKIVKERKKNGGVRAYKEKLIAMVEVKRAFAAERKEGKLTRFYELKMMEEERWKAKVATEERKVQAGERRLPIEEQRLAMEAEERINKRQIEEHRLALEAEEHKNKRSAEEHAIMFMDPSKMDERARQY